MSTITFVTSYAKLERRLFADLLLEVGPDAPTLCEGWTTRDLAAHIVVRDRRPDAMIGMVVPPLAGHGEHLRLTKAAQPFPQIVQEVRTPPLWSPISNPLTDRLANTAEFFIHREDVRRAGGDWEPRVLDRAEEADLWRTTRLSARMVLRRAGVAATLRAEGFAPLTVGENPQVTVAGPVGELTMFLSGRQRAARVEVTGPDPLVERIKAADGF